MTKLEFELNLIRKTRAATLQSTADEENESENEVFIGAENKSFSFDDLEAKVEFIEFTAKPGKGQSAELGAIQGWLNSVLA